MWKKDETPTPAPVGQPERSAAPVPPAANAAATLQRSGERASIGRSIAIRGDVTGDEDLLIQGRVEGSVELTNHVVTIGAEGEVKASVSGRVVIVEGTVEGDIRSEEQVVLRASARVRGDITAPRLVLEDGARFRGGVDMGDVPGFGPETGAPSATKESSRASARGAEKPVSTATAGASDAGQTGDSGGGSGAKKKGSPELFAEARG